MGPTPPLIDQAPATDAEVHRRLVRRGSGLLHGPAGDGLRLTLGDAMMAVVVLAVGLALLRRSVPVGVVALNVACPALVRTVLLMARLRSSGGSPTVGRWAVGFASSSSRAAATFALCALAYAAGFGAGYVPTYLAALTFFGASSVTAKYAGLALGAVTAALAATPASIVVGVRLLAISDRAEATPSRRPGP